MSTTMNESARIVAQSRRAADALRVFSTDAKNAALLRLAELLESSWPSVAAANERDVTEAASHGRAGALL
ncbi:MAG: gamma-glutamyl-phosphate reductase, partial [Armatimonadetes bacterium]|nr:gamma-glutamyl-phosphate reductase [Armatimonadota bacterium]